MVEPNNVYNCDCLELMRQMDDNMIALTVTSPPYFNLKEYGESFTGWATYEYYLADNRKWFEQLYRITMGGGYVCWNIQETIPNPTNEGRKDLPLLADIIKIATDVGFIWERQIIWSKHNSTQLMLGSYPYPPTPIFKQTKESILVFRKLGKREYTKEQKEKCKVDADRWFSIMDDIWEIAPAKASELQHDAPFPIEIPKRFIQVMTVNDDIVFEPFSGTFTTEIACHKLQRKFIGAEIDKEYYERGLKRFNDETAQLSIFDLI